MFKIIKRKIIKTKDEKVHVAVTLKRETLTDNSILYNVHVEFRDNFSKTDNVVFRYCPKMRLEGFSCSSEKEATEKYLKTLEYLEILTNFEQVFS